MYFRTITINPPADNKTVVHADNPNLSNTKVFAANIKYNVDTGRITKMYLSYNNIIIPFSTSDKDENTPNAKLECYSLSPRNTTIQLEDGTSKHLDVSFISFCYGEVIQLTENVTIHSDTVSEMLTNGPNELKLKVLDYNPLVLESPEQMPNDDILEELQALGSITYSDSWEPELAGVQFINVDIETV